MNRRQAHIVFNIIMCMLAAAILFGVGRCATASAESSESPENPEAAEAAETSRAATTGAAEATAAADSAEHTESYRILALLTPPDTAAARNPHSARLDSMPGRDCVKLRVTPLSGGTLRRTFSDSNCLHLQAAALIGIEPMTGLRPAWRAGERLARIHTCEDFYLDNLTHSVPYLVPEARQLLHDIGRAFRDTLAARGGGDYRVKVTSVLRTPALVKQLRRRNRNSVDSSAHLYGTTFDLSYSEFICNRHGGPYRTQEDLKNLLGEIVWEFRSRGRCWVVYERRQSCFHITARPAGSPPPPDQFARKN